MTRLWSPGPERRNRGRRGSVSRLGAAAVVLLILVAVLLRQEYTSVERGNRLIRSGDRASALVLYERASERGRAGPEATYNLGTALLPEDPRRGDTILTRLAGSDSTEVSRLSHYNLGVRALLEAERTDDPDSTRLRLFEAVEHTKTALMLNPSDADARWNLALAERRLQEIFEGMDEADRRNSEVDDDEFIVDDPSLSRSEEADGVSGPEPEERREAERIGERQGAREGAREAWATQDPGPLTAADAMGLLERTEDDPATLIRGFLWAHRPDVAWWEAQPYPGGQW